MTPPRLDPLSVQAKLRLLVELIDDLDQIGDVDQARLVRERLTRRALERVLTQVVELASSIAGHIAASRLPIASATYRGSFTDAATLGVIEPDLAASLAAAAGMRNVLVHDYVRVDLALVADAVPMLRRDADAFVGQVSRWLREVS